MGYDDLLRFLRELDGSLEKLTTLQEEKRAAVQDVDSLNECMKRGQAISLALRGLEGKRLKLMSELGLEGVPLRDLPGRCPPEHRTETSQAVEQVLRSYQVLQSAQKAARTVLEGRLHHVEAELKRRGLDPEETASAVHVSRDREHVHTDFKA